MRQVKALRLYRTTAFSGSYEGELWYDNSAAQKTLAFYDGTTEQFVPTKALLASLATGDGAELLGVEQTLANLVGTTVQTVLEDIDFKVGALESSLEWEPQVLDFLDDPSTVTPSTGDRYIVGTSPVGAFAGQANSIAEWNGSSWDFQAIAAGPNSVNEGVAAFVQDLDTAYVVNDAGNWVVWGSIVTHNALGGLQGGTSGEYYHLSQADYNLVLGLDSTANGDGASTIATEAGAFSFLLTGETEVQGSLNKLDKLGSNAVGEGASGIAIESGSVSNFLNGITDLQALAEKLDSLGSTANGDGASQVKIEDLANFFTSDNVEGALIELSGAIGSGLRISRSNAITFSVGATVAYVHNIGNRQVHVMVQDANAGNADEWVGAFMVPTTGNENNSVDITIDEAGDYFVTVIG